VEARYLIRFDDICPTMHWGIWQNVERILDDCQVKPILAVVPDNKDPNLQVYPPRPDFWEWLHKKYVQGWTIGIHGYQHLYETEDAGLLGIHSRSEFAGLPRERQREKIAKALEIFEHHGIRPQLFVAPAHSFDRETLTALRDNDIRVISDGFFLKPVQWLDMVWIPQQMWQFRAMPFGVWTICYHHNRLSERDLRRFLHDVARFAARIVSVDDILRCIGIGKERTLADSTFYWLWRQALLLKLRVRGAFHL
jgi:predicted deacetylase